MTRLNTRHKTFHPQSRKSTGFTVLRAEKILTQGGKTRGKIGLTMGYRPGLERSFPSTESSLVASLGAPSNGLP
jgi:hypothetical protein